MSKIEPKILKGFRDYDPAEQSARQSMFFAIQKVFESFGFLPLSTPALEYKEILMGKYGEDEKLIYSFKDKGDRDVAMRYDLTVPLARYVALNQNQMVMPFKRYQIAPVWRADNPQKGRLREFYQCDIDVVGTDSVLADAEVIVCLCKAIESLGVTNYLVRLNNRELFKIFTSVLKGKEEQVAEIIRAIDKVGKIGKEGVLKILSDKKISSEAIKLTQQWLDIGSGIEALGSLPKFVPKALLTEMEFAWARIIQLYGMTKIMGIPSEKISFDPTMARGLDYYTSTVFEIVLPDMPEYGSICGGGRYDSLVDQYSKVSVSAVGGSIGIDRLFEAMVKTGLVKPSASADVIILNLEKDLGMQDEYLKIATILREAGISCEVYYENPKLDKQFKYAESKGINYAVIMGGTEKNSGTVKVKNLKTREEKEIKETELVSFFGK